jgi:hypothetical protein
MSRGGSRPQATQAMVGGVAIVVQNYGARWQWYFAPFVLFYVKVARGVSQGLILDEGANSSFPVHLSWPAEVALVGGAVRVVGADT